MTNFGSSLDGLSYVAATVVLGILWWRLFLVPRRPPEPPPLADPRAAIRDLAQRGRSAVEIAADLGISRGEVELVLALPPVERRS